jgi:hypothetical protein
MAAFFCCLLRQPVSSSPWNELATSPQLQKKSCRQASTRTGLVLLLLMSVFDAIICLHFAELPTQLLMLLITVDSIVLKLDSTYTYLYL